MNQRVMPHWTRDVILSRLLTRATGHTTTAVVVLDCAMGANMKLPFLLAAKPQLNPNELALSHVKSHAAKNSLIWRMSNVKVAVENGRHSCTEGCWTRVCGCEDRLVKEYLRLDADLKVHSNQADDET